MIIADIIKWNQPQIYEALLAMITAEAIIGAEYIPLEEDELPEFLEMKKLMEERRGVAL